MCGCCLLLLFACVVVVYLLLGVVVVLFVCLLCVLYCFVYLVMFLLFSVVGFCLLSEGGPKKTIPEVSSKCHLAIISYVFMWHKKKSELKAPLSYS